MFQPGQKSLRLTALDEQGNTVTVPHEEDLTLLWFNPIFGRYGCKECETSLIHNAYADLRLEGCRPIGATYDPPEVNARRNEPHVWRIPLIQVDRDTAEAWGALRDEADSWAAYTPKSVSYLISSEGVVLHSWYPVDHRTHANDVLAVLRGLKEKVGV